MAAPPRSPGPGASSWRAVRMPRQAMAHTLQQRYSLRWHGVAIGSFTLALMWAVSSWQMHLGVESLALRYCATLTVGYLGYLGYLLVLRAWAARLLRQSEQRGDNGTDMPDLWPDIGGSSGAPSHAPLPRTGGGSFGGGGASGDFAPTVPVSAPCPSLPGDLGGDTGSSALENIASGAADAVAGADEGAVVVVPVVAIFLIGAALILGAGSLALVFFGWEVLLTVAVELAFSMATARAAMGVEREGWLSAAVRLTWKPLLGALLCAVLLGAAIDHFLPQVHSLPEALRALRGP